MAMELDHVVMEVRDVERSLEFYSKVLGLTGVRVADFRAGRAPFVSVRINRKTVIDLFPRPMWGNPRRAQNPNHFCLTVDERGAAALRRRMKKAGVDILRRNPRSFGAQGWGRSIYFSDPDGAAVEVRYYSAGAKPARSGAR